MEALWGHLGSFGLGAAGIASRTKLWELSGGQRVAFAFAELCLSSPSILLCDEPNSHLDLDAIQGLETSLQRYTGAIVLVSHDLFGT